MIPLNLPPDLEAMLRRELGDDLDRFALEALAIEGYRQAKLSAGQLAGLLGLPTSIAAQQWLAARGIPLNYGLDDLAADRAALDAVFATLSERYASGETDTAARHNEHQP